LYHNRQMEGKVAPAESNTFSANECVSRLTSSSSRGINQKNNQYENQESKRQRLVQYEDFVANHKNNDIDRLSKLATEVDQNNNFCSDEKKSNDSTDSVYNRTDPKQMQQYQLQLQAADNLDEHCIGKSSIQQSSPHSASSTPPTSPGKIQKIDAKSVQRIVAGQAVTDLASAVKELVDNALDACSQSINSK
jgi:hypothetical protein